MKPNKGQETLAERGIDPTQLLPLQHIFTQRNLQARSIPGRPAASLSPPPQKAHTQVIDTMQWGMSGDDAEAAAETRKRARQCGPECVALLHYVVRSDNFASITQRVRAASTLLEAGGFLSSEAKETGLFREPEGTDSADERERA